MHTYIGASIPVDTNTGGQIEDADESIICSEDTTTTSGVYIYIIYI
jgi:hypothetical protein